MKVIIPEDISEITLGQYQEYENLIKRAPKIYELGKIIKNGYLTERDIVLRTVKIFTGLKYNEVESMNYTDLVDMVELIKKALETESPFKNRFELGGVEFGFIPNFDNIKAKEYFDLSEYNNSIDELHKLMAILYRPIKNKDMLGNYNIVDYQGTNEWAEVMKNTPLNIVNGALGFFLTLSTELLIYTQRYLKKENQQKGNQQDTISKSGGGIRRFTGLQKESPGDLAK